MAGYPAVDDRWLRRLAGAWPRTSGGHHRGHHCLPRRPRYHGGVARRMLRAQRQHLGAFTNAVRELESVCRALRLLRWRYQDLPRAPRWPRWHCIPVGAGDQTRRLSGRAPQTTGATAGRPVLQQPRRQMEEPMSDQHTKGAVASAAGTPTGQWLRHARITNDPAGDLIAERHDPGVPRLFPNVEAMRGYLRSRGACRE